MLAECTVNAIPHSNSIIAVSRFSASRDARAENAEARGYNNRAPYSEIHPKRTMISRGKGGGRKKKAMQLYSVSAFASPSSSLRGFHFPRELDSKRAITFVATEQASRSSPIAIAIAAR